MDQITKYRKRVIELSYQHKANHIKSSMTVVPLLLEARAMGYRTILSKGHAAFAWYATMDRTPEELELPFHLCDRPSLLSHTTPGVDLTSGSLGHGLGVAVGMVHVEAQHVAVILGDGECQEGSVWEAARYLGRRPDLLSFIHVYVDCNGMSSIDNNLNSRDWIDNMFRACGVCADCRLTQTGVSFMNDVLWHYRVMDSVDYEKAIKELNENNII